MPGRENKYYQEQHSAEVKSKARQIRGLDFKKTENCKFLVNSFRELEEIVNKRYKYCPTEEFTGQTNIIDQIVNRAMVLKPYMSGNFMQQMSMLDDYQLAHLSIMNDCSRVANRQCYEPKVKIDGELVFEFQNPNYNKLKKNYTSVYSCYKNGLFLLSLQAEPNYSLMFTLNGKNPLLSSPEEKKFPGQTFVQNMQPPCTISVLAINNQFCLPSRVLTIIVKKTQANGRDQQINKQSGMIRPDPDLDLEQSRSNYSQIFQL